MHCLLNPLEFISSIEEPNIRETAIASAKKLALGQSPEFFTQHLYQMVKRLVMWDNYTSKISGIALIPTCFRHLPPEEYPGLKAVVKELGKDDTPMVRRAVAGILQELSSLYDEESFKSDLKPMLYLFLADDIDSVKMKALEQMPSLARYIEEKERDSTLLEFVLKMDANKKNWRIRYHLPDSLTGLASDLSKEALQSKVIPFYQTLVKDSEHEVRSNALNQFVGFAKTVHQRFGDKELTIPIVEAMKDLAKDPSHHVRASLVGVFSGAVGDLSEIFVRTQLMDLMLGLLKDEVIDVKLLTIRSISCLYPYLTPAIIRERVISEFKTIAADKNWKLRYEVLKALPALLETGHEELIDEFVQLNELVRDDHICCIRVRIASNLIESYKPSQSQKLNDLIERLVKYWSESNNYIFRVSCLSLLERFVGTLDKKLYQPLMESIVEKLKKDRVHNVRLNVLRLILTVLPSSDREFREQFVGSLIRELKDDKDPDVALNLELVKDKLAAAN